MNFKLTLRLCLFIVFDFNSQSFLSYDSALLRGTSCGVFGQWAIDIKHAYLGTIPKRVRSNQRYDRDLST